MRDWSNTLRQPAAGFLAMVLLAAPCAAQSASQGDANTAPTLNEQILSRFAETWIPITNAVETADKEFDHTHLPGLAQSLHDMAATDGPRSARDELVANYGYADFEQWADIAQRSILAAQWAKQPPSEDELKRTIMALQADPGIAADARQSLVNDVSAAFAIALAHKPSDADIDAAKAVLPLLEPVIGRNE